MKRSKLLLILIVLCSNLFQLSAFGQEVGKVEIGTIHRLSSNILKEDRTYIVGLPKSYRENVSASYPVLVLLDGEANFHSHSGIIEQMSSSRQIPEMIIVAIPNTDRVRDFTPSNYLTGLNGFRDEEGLKTSGGSQAFLQFMEEELLPVIDKKYRTTAFRLLVGHSHGGLLVGSSYLSENSSFDAFISVDPSFWWDDQLVVKEIDHVDLERLRNKKFYLSTADNYENLKQISHVFDANINAHELFNAKIRNKGISASDFKLRYFEKENHWTVALLSMYRGLQFVFKDLVMEDLYSSSIEDITAYYQKNYAGKFSPSEAAINRMGYHYLQEEKDLEKALQFFQLNVTNFPKSYNTYDSLGDAYKALGNKKMALENYLLAVKINPDYELGKKKIKEMRD